MTQTRLAESYAGLHAYWGDLHCHVRERRRDRNSSGRPGAGGPYTLDEVYAFGREETRLDFVAITDHDNQLDEREWEETLAAAERNTTGNFVAFPGFEWSHVLGGPAAEYGHRHVVYRNSPAPLLSCIEPGTDTAPGLWQALREQVGVENVLVVPHHTSRAASSICWNLEHWDPDLERLVEIYSLWGCCERAGSPFPVEYLKEHSPTGEGELPGHYAQDALARGYRFGFVAGSESHDGRPGNPRYHGDYECGVRVCYRGGIQATYAPSLSRDDLMEGFRARRCYATTGVKIGLQFSLNGALMGSEVAACENRNLAFSVAGTARLRCVEIIRNNEVAFREEPVDVEHGQWLWPDVRPADSNDYYYVRVTQQDGSMAWSSPIFVG